MQVKCPSCQAGSVGLPVWKFSDTSVDVPVCGSCQAAGLVSVTMKVSALAGLSVAEVVGHRHQDGLVVLTGGQL